MAKFEVGGKVFALKTFIHGSKVVCTKGEVYEVNSMRKGFCTCCDLLLDIGIASDPSHISFCETCKKQITNHGVWWLDSVNFAPLEELSETTVEQFLSTMPIQKELVEK